MKKLIPIFVLFSLPLKASVMGISTHPLNSNGKVFSAEMMGYMSDRNEMGAGIRYTQEVDDYKTFDFKVSGGQESRGLTLGMGLDFELLNEDIIQPRVSLKPYFEHQRFEDINSTYMGLAPSVRKGFSVARQEVFPYIAVPSGIKLDSATDEFVFYSSLSLGASMPFPMAGTDKLLLSLEANKNLGSSADSVGCMVSWVWK